MKWLKGLFALLLCVVLCGMTAAAEEENPIADELDMSGAQTLYDSLSDELKSELDQIGIEGMEPDDLLGLSLPRLGERLWRALRERAFAPVRVFAAIAGILLLNAIFSAFRETLSRQSAAAKTLSVVSALAAFAVIAAPVTELVGDCVKTIQSCGNFMLSFIPVYGAALTLSGKVATAGAYGGTLLLAVELMTRLLTALLLPLVSVYLAFSVCGAASDTVNLTGMAETVKRVALWGIGILLTVFLGFLSFQSIVANASDTVGVRTAKYIIGSSVPVVGGAMSEAYNTLSGCMGLLRSTVGVFGVVVCLLLCLPVVLDAAVMTLSLHVAAFFGDMLGDQNAVRLVKSAASAMSILLGILLFVLMMCMVSTAVTLTVSAGGG